MNWVGVDRAHFFKIIVFYSQMGLNQSMELDRFVKGGLFEELELLRPFKEGQSSGKSY